MATLSYSKKKFNDRLGGFFVGGDFTGEEFILNVLSNIGLPGAVCLYTLFGVNKSLQKQDTTLSGLTDAINRLTSDIDRRLDKQEDETRHLRNTVDELKREISALQRGRG